MMASKRYATIVILICTWNCANGQHVTEPQVTPTPACAFINAWIDCVGLEAENMDMLGQALHNVSLVADNFAVNLIDCDGPSIPVDMFHGYNVQNIFFHDCRFKDMPYELLSSLDHYQTIEVMINYDQFNTTIAEASDIILPFAGNLTIFTIENAGFQKIEPNFFEQFFSLAILYLDQNNLESIGLEFLGKDTLYIMYFGNNSISAIESGAFQDLKNLQYLDLSFNNLTELQEEAFDGLETSPITTMLLRGNPFNCTCDLQWLKDWLNDRDLTYYSFAQCAYPEVAYFNDIDFC